MPKINPATFVLDDSVIDSRKRTMSFQRKMTIVYHKGRERICVLTKRNGTL